MNHVFTWAAALALIFTPTQPLAGDTMTQEEQAVLATVETMTAAFQQGDIDTVMSTYEPAATVMFEPGAEVSEAAQLREMFTAMSGVNPVFTYAGHEVIVSGGTAIHIAPWSMTGQTPDGQEIAQSGLSIAVLRKQADGSWKMVIDNPHGSALMEP